MGSTCSLRVHRAKGMGRPGCPNRAVRRGGRLQEKKYPSRGSCRDGLGGIGEWKDGGMMFWEGTLDELFASTDQGPEPFGQQGDVERFFKGFVNCGAVEAQHAAVVGQQGDEDDLGELGITPQVLADL